MTIITLFERHHKAVADTFGTNLPQHPHIEMWVHPWTSGGAISHWMIDAQATRENGDTCNLRLNPNAGIEGLVWTARDSLGNPVRLDLPRLVSDAAEALDALAEWVDA